MAQVKPTLLAFHGSGSNGTIHTVQLARLSRFLKPDFEIESLTGTIPSSAGPGILPFFDGCGPYYRWAPPTESLTMSKLKEGAPPSLMPPEVESLVRSTVESIRAKGGRVVGLIGFSQGTRIVAGLLKGAELRAALDAESPGAAAGLEWLDFAFGLSVCSSTPPPLLPGSVVQRVQSRDVVPAERQAELLEAKIRIPTLHVLGNQDEWRWAGKLLVQGSYEADGEGQPGKGHVYEFSMGHHYPVIPEDTEKLVNWVMGTWEGVQKGA